MLRCQAIARSMPLILLLWSVFTAPGFAAAAGSFTETFATTQYKSSFTTAVWDTVAGELRLPPFVLTTLGTFVTAGSAEDVCLEGDYLYVADGSSGVQVLDVTDPAAPTLAGAISTPGGAAGLAAEGNRLYVADRGFGLQVLDISDPTNPVLIGNYDTAGFAFDVAVSGDYAYVANNNQPVSVIDISDPAFPVLVTSIPMSNFAQGVAVEGKMLFVADGYAGLAVIDIIDPSAPIELAHVDTPGFARNVVVSGNIAYVADLDAGLHVVDFTNRGTPVSVGSLATPEPTVGLCVDGDWLYLASTGRMYVVDISDPANPVQRHEWVGTGGASAVVVGGENAFLADGSVGGVQVIRVADATGSPVEVFAYSQGTCTPAIAGNYAYVGRYAGFFQGYEMLTFDLSNPVNPAYRGARPISSIPQDLVIAGDFLYAALNEAGLTSFSLVNPITPTQGFGYDPGGAAMEVAVAGNTLFGAFWDSTLHAVDAATWSVRSIHALPELARDLVVEGNILYAPCGGSGLQLVDISDPSALLFAGQFVPASGAYSVAVNGNRAYVGGNDGWYVLDVSNTSAVTQMSYSALGEFVTGITVTGDIAFVTTPSKLQVVDISSPWSPSYVSSTAATLGFDEPVLYGDQLMVRDSDLEGFRIFRVRERLFDQTTAVGLSTVLDSPLPDICRAQIIADQDDAVRWELSNGYSFQEATANGDWLQFQFAGDSMRWSATLVPVTPDVNPTVRDLRINWLYNQAAIDAIVDVPNDQGGQVRLQFTRSGRDFADETGAAAASYTIYRRADDPLLKQRLAARKPETGAEPVGLETVSFDGHDYVQGGPAKANGFPPGIWESITSLGARQADTYLSLVPTLSDSGTVVQPSVYTVVTHTTTPAVWYVSLPDSGFSVDNIAPGVPQGFTAAYGDAATTLAWLASPEPDFQYYRVYRGVGDGFVPSPANLVQATASAGWVDPVDNPWRFRYKITALDHAGNESEAAVVGEVSAVPGGLPTQFALHQCVPNPFNPTTTIGYDLPKRTTVRLTVFDVAGRLVRSLVPSEVLGAGRHEVVWNGRNESGRSVSAGLYFFRLEAGGFQATKRMTLVK